MALLNGIYVNVVDEHMEDDVEVTSHPVEQGADISDHVNIRSDTLSLSGNIVSTDTLSAAEILDQIQSWKRSKTLVRYEGRNFGDGFLIISCTTSHPNTVKGGCKFDMTLKRPRIAHSMYVADENTQPETVTVQPSVGNLEVGQTVVFTGGDVFVSSDAQTKAATRGRSTCEVTLLSRADWSVHPIHLVSTDGGMVYGWVDEGNIAGVQSDNTETKPQTDAGLQQIAKGA